MPALAPILLGFFAAGLAGSLHCIGMCGPILLSAAALSSPQPITVNGRDTRPCFSMTRLRLTLIDSLPNHFGRLLTYAALGALAGSLGARFIQLLDSSALMQRASALTGWLTIIVALSLLLWTLGLSRVLMPRSFAISPAPSLPACAAPFARLLTTRAASSSLIGRILVGGLMGLLPCGLLYAMLLSAAALANPFASSAAMIAFGLGTLPALSAALITLGSLPSSVRRHGHALAAFTLLLLGVFLLWRARSIDPFHSPDPRHLLSVDSPACPLCPPPHGLAETTVDSAAQSSADK